VTFIAGPFFLFGTSYCPSATFQLHKERTEVGTVNVFMQMQRKLKEKFGKTTKLNLFCSDKAAMKTA